MLPEVVGAVFMRSYSRWQENAHFFLFVIQESARMKVLSLKSQNRLLKHAPEYVCDHSLTLRALTQYEKKINK